MKPSEPSQDDLKKARKLLEKMERFSLAGEATGTVGFDSEGNTVCYSESNLNTLAQAISEARAEGRLDPPSLKVTHVKKLLDEARREEGEIVHKQMDAIMDKAMDRARREERKRFKEIVMNEPELPGDAPVDIKNQPIEAVCRAACRVTKKNIIKAIEDLP